MKVKLKDKASASLVGEMGIGEIGYIAEMVTDPQNLTTFGFGADVAAKALQLKTANDDEKAEFPVVRVEEGWSESGRLWSGNTLESIVNQTNSLEPVGHLGHIPDADAATSFPDPQTVWLGAIVKTEASKERSRVGEMVKVAYFAGYNLPGAKVRGYIKSRAVRGISWWGTADQVPIPGKGVEIKNFTLKALDWARKLSEGMPTSRIVAIAKEMEDKMDKELSQVTPEEFKRDNPNGYALLVAEATADSRTTIGEMEEKVTKGEEAQSLLSKVCEAIGVKDAENLLTAITELKTKVGDKAKTLVATALDKLLEEKVPDEEKRAIVRRLLPVGEMENKASEAKDDAEATKIVGEMVTATFDSDDIVKGIVSEMAPPVVRRREELRGGEGKNEYMQGMETRHVA